MINSHTCVKANPCVQNKARARPRCAQAREDTLAVSKTHTHVLAHPPPTWTTTSTASVFVCTCEGRTCISSSVFLSSRPDGRKAKTKRQVRDSPASADGLNRLARTHARRALVSPSFAFCHLYGDAAETPPLIRLKTMRMKRRRSPPC